MATRPEKRAPVGAESSHCELPDDKTLAEAGDVMIMDKESKSLPLKSLWSGRPEDERQLIIFVRNFFCGLSISTALKLYPLQADWTQISLTSLLKLLAIFTGFE